MTLHAIREFFDADTAENPQDVLLRLQQQGKAFARLYDDFYAKREFARANPAYRAQWVKINQMAAGIRDVVRVVNRGMDMGNNFTVSVFARQLFQLMPDFSVNYMRTALVAIMHVNGLMGSFLNESEKFQKQTSAKEEPDEARA